MPNKPIDEQVFIESLSKFLSLSAKKDQIIHRDTFLYYDPTEPKEKFAQCETCRFFVSENNLEGKIKHDACVPLGPKVEIYKDSSCGLYTPWLDGKPNEEIIKVQAKEILNSKKGALTPKDVGLVHRQVRCQNCHWYNGKGGCELFYKLTKSNPKKFKLDEKVNEYGCCNAQTPKE